MQKTILFVEDNADDVELAFRIFQKCGASQQVEVARDGQEALDYIYGQGPYAGQEHTKTLRLIILDLNLPKVPGIEVIRQLATDPRTRTLPVAVLTVSGM